MELSEAKLRIVCIGLQVFPNVCLCVLHTTTSWNRGKELRVNELSGRWAADLWIPSLLMVNSQVISANFKLIVPFVIEIE